MREAALYTRLEADRVRCSLCTHRCTIADGQRGICHVRENRGGTLYSLVYGRLISQAVDPIEKKPLFHFLPGSTSMSVATAGCNFRCTFCQNAGISLLVRDGDGRIEGQEVAPERIVRAAQRYGCRSISYTYTEPTIFYEYAYDIAVLAHAGGLANVFVTNGYMTAEMLDTLTWDDQPPLLDAANVDLKAFTDAFYKRECGARLQPVLDSLTLMKRRGVWLEITTLLIPGLNDSDAELRDLTHWMVTELGPDTPWHISRFHPTYRLTDRPPTPVDTLHRARDIGRQAGLRYVYEGNVPGAGGEDTLCPVCGQVAIKRVGFDVYANTMRQGTCAYCGAAVSGVWE